MRSNEIFFSSSLSQLWSHEQVAVWIWIWDVCCMFLAQISSVNITLTGSTGIIWELRDIKRTDLWTSDYQQYGVNCHRPQFIKVLLVSHRQTSPTWFTMQVILSKKQPLRQEDLIRGLPSPLLAIKWQQ